MILWINLVSVVASLAATAALVLIPQLREAFNLASIMARELALPILTGCTGLPLTPKSFTKPHVRCD